MLTAEFSDQIKRLQSSSGIDHEFSVIWVPRRTLVCNKILEEAGVLGDVSVEQFPLYFIPLEQDVLSLALEDSFGDLYLVSESKHSGFVNLSSDAKKEEGSNIDIPCSPGSYATAAKVWAVSTYYRKG